MAKEIHNIEINNIKGEINIGQDNLDYGNQEEHGEFNYNTNENADFPSKTFVKLETDYEKKFGRLYKTFDVRFIKTKIWESLNFVKFKYKRKNLIKLF